MTPARHSYDVLQETTTLHQPIKSHIYCIRRLLCTATILIGSASAATKEAEVPVSSPVSKVDSSTAKIVGSIASINKDLQDQNARVLESGKRLAAFSKSAKDQQAYIDAAKDHETNLRLLREMANLSIAKLLEISKSNSK